MNLKNTTMEKQEYKSSWSHSKCSLVKEIIPSDIDPIVTIEIHAHMLWNITISHGTKKKKY